MPGGRNFDVQIDYMRQVGEMIFGNTIERDDVWKIIESIKLPKHPEGVAVDCGFYELPESLADGSIEHLTYANFTPQNVIAATAISFGETYKKYANVILKGEQFDRCLHFTGGAVLKNKYLRDTITEIMGIENVSAASTDEVYGGMFRLALRCK